MLKVLKDESIYSAILITAFYGLRRSEVLGLRWSDISFKNKTVSICNTVVEHDTIVVKERMKTESSRRTLPLIKPVENYLVKLKASQEENKAFFVKVILKAILSVGI